VEAVRREPRHVAALQALGTLERREGANAEAERWFRRAMAAGDERETARPRLELAELLLAKEGTEAERQTAREEAEREIAVVLRHFPRWKRALELRERNASLPR
jgi:hypothetical protein